MCDDGRRTKPTQALETLLAYVAAPPGYASVRQVRWLARTDLAEHDAQNRRAVSRPLATRARRNGVTTGVGESLDAVTPTLAAKSRAAERMAPQTGSRLRGATAYRVTNTLVTARRTSTNTPAHKRESSKRSDSDSYAEKTSSPAWASRGSNIKPPRPVKFNGHSDELLGWLEQFENYSTAAGVTEDARTPLMMAFLPDDIRDYVQFETHSHELPDFQRFKELLITKYLGEDPETLYGQLVHEAAQTASESLVDYGLRFRRLVKVANMYSLQIDPMTAVTKYISGVRDPMTKAYLKRERLADRAWFNKHNVRPSAALLDDFIHYARSCESSVDKLPSKAARSPAIAAMAVHAEEPEEPRPSARAAKAPAPCSTGLPFDLAEFAKSLAPLLAPHLSPAPKGASSRRDLKDFDWTNTTCFNCGSKGHGYNRCGEPRDSDATEQRRAKFERRLPRNSAADGKSRSDGASPATQPAGK